MNSLKQFGVFHYSVKLTFVANDVVVNIMCEKDIKLHLLHFLYLKMLKALHVYLKKAPTNPVTIGVSNQKADYEQFVGEPYKIMIPDIYKDRVNEVSNYFGKFGVIKNTSATTEEEILAVKYVYNDAEVYCKVIQKEHVISGQKIKLIPLAPLLGKIPDEKFEDRQLSIIHRIAGEKTFDDQLIALENKFEINKYTLQQKHKTISDNLKSILTSYLTIFDVHVFSFDFYESNLNVFVDLVRDPELKTLQKIKNILHLTRDYSNFNETQKPVPAIICKHDKTEITLQINLRKATVRIDSLIKYYLNLDPKLRSLIILIKFWSERYGLFGWESFSVEMLCFLMIFYLQQEPYKLPSVYDLQKNSIPHLIEGWNCGYIDFFDFTNESLQNVTIKELLIGFFKFYSNFDYVSNIISVFLGRPIEKIHLMKPYNLPEGFEKYVKQQKDIELDCGLCIQDPFEHSRNMCHLNNPDFVGRFTSLCRCAHKIMQSEDHQLLYRLFLYCEVPDYVEFPSFVIDKDNTQNLSEWIQTIKKYTMKLLTEILKCKLSRIATFGVSQSVSYACVGQYNLWNNRIEAWKKLSNSNFNSSEKEVAITSAVIANSQPETFWSAVIELNFVKTANPRVKVSFLKKGGSFDVYHLCHFFYTRLEKFLEDEASGKNFVTSTKSEEVTETTATVPEEKEKDEKPKGEDQEQLPGRRKRKSEEEEEYDAFTEEDIPSDFFDDFTKEDFLKRLDIVDVWDANSKKSDELSTQKKKSGSSKSTSRSKHKEHRRSRPNDKKRSRSRSKSSSRHVRSRSRNQISRSPKSRRLPRKRTRSKSRSHSPPRKSRRTDLPKRRPFLEEITEKLKEMEKSSPSPPVTTKTYDNQYFPSTSSYSNYGYFNPYPQPTQYDESFYVGTSIWHSQVGAFSVPPPPLPSFPSDLAPTSFVPPPPPASSLSSISSACNSIVPPPPPGSSLSITSPVSTSIAPSLPPRSSLSTISPDSISNGPLLPPADSPLSISSFSSTEGIIDDLSKTQEVDQRDKKHSVGKKISQVLSAKAEVLPRCQHIIKLLTRKGRLAVVEARNRSSKESSKKHPSPLSSVEFSFTKPSKTGNIVDDFTFVLNKILDRFGLFDDDVDDLGNLVTKFIGCYDLDKEDIVGALKDFLLGEDADILANINYTGKSDTGTQCNDNRDTSNVGIQVDRTSLCSGSRDGCAESKSTESIKQHL